MPEFQMCRQFWLQFFLSPIYSKISVEYEWISKISQLRTKIVFNFWEKVGFSGKTLDFSKIAEDGSKLVVEWVSNDIIS